MYDQFFFLLIAFGFLALYLLDKPETKSGKPYILKDVWLIIALCFVLGSFFVVNNISSSVTTITTAINGTITANAVYTYTPANYNLLAYGIGLVLTVIIFIFLVKVVIDLFNMRKN